MVDRRVSDASLVDDPQLELELKQPYTETTISRVLNPFPEAVVADPVLAGRRHVGTFENDSLEDFYRPIDTYEGRHRYDPQFVWEKKEETRLVRKVNNQLPLPSLASR